MRTHASITPPCRSASARGFSRARRLLIALACGLGSIAGGGCELAAIAAQGIKENTPVKVASEYDGLEGKSFAVVVSADRTAEAEFPAIGYEIQRRVTSDLAENTGASGYVPADQVQLFQSRNPGWPAMRRSELAERLGGVERIILIELFDFRLREPGNEYIWDGTAAGTVGVVEADGSLPDEIMFQSSIRVGFPDEMGYGPDDFDAQVVSSALIQRFSNRAAWVFYDHTEPPGIEY